jgi:hypothetical protein
VRRAAFALAALVVAAGCRHPGPGRPLDPDDARVRGALAGLASRVERREALRAVARFSVDSEDLSFRSSQRLAARRPASLRVELLGLFSQVAGVLVTDGRFYQFYDAGTGELEQGPVTPHLLWDVARVDLSAGQAVELLLGGAAPGARLQRAAAELLPDGGLGVRLDDVRGTPRQRFRFDAQGRLRSVEVLDWRGLPLWEAAYDDYREVGGESFAYDIDVRFPRLDARASFRFQQVELASELPDALFRLDLARRPARAVGAEPR